MSQTETPQSPGNEGSTPSNPIELDSLPQVLRDLSPERMTVKALRARVRSHDAYICRQRALRSARYRAVASALRAELSRYQSNWWRTLSPQAEREVNSWPKERVELILEDAYNQDTDAGKTMSSNLLFHKRVGLLMDYWQARARKSHLEIRRWQAEQAGKAGN
ncbi:MAG: hypothetical protein QOE70_954 [Chthoniobacter sp.]|jgi:hypothetical protein|nr:hypothetical protein [Chthoniobacter sp.]